MKTASDYYGGVWPETLFVHPDGENINVSLSSDPQESGAIIAQIPKDERGAFYREIVRRWNHSSHREQAIMDIRKMSQNRKTCIRMPNGMTLYTFCGQALL